MTGTCPDCGGPLERRLHTIDHRCRDCGFVLSALSVLAAGARPPVNMADVARMAELLPRPVGSKDAALRRKFYVSPYTKGDE